MSKRRLYICLVVAGLVILLGLAIASLCEDWPLLYYRQFTSLRELPTRLIRPAFRMITDRELPQKADGLRAIFQGGREAGIFVRFETDSKGIAYILEAYGRPIVSTFDEDFLRTMTASNASIFSTPSRWQERIGVRIFDQKSIESGRLIRIAPITRTAPWYRLFIDDDRSVVYIHSSLH